MYPEGWPKCVCGEPTLDGKITCGDVVCNQRLRRVIDERSIAELEARKQKIASDSSELACAHCGKPRASGLSTCGDGRCEAAERYHIACLAEQRYSLCDVVEMGELAGEVREALRGSLSGYITGLWERQQGRPVGMPTAGIRELAVRFDVKVFQEMIDLASRHVAQILSGIEVKLPEEH